MNSELGLAPISTDTGEDALARLYGAPLHALPDDLYIPPDALEIVLEAFEGPLDLLLYLIRKANLDILDIPMASLTAQYLGYVEAMRRHKLDLAADYLLMAATLLEIKSRMLLPRPPRREEDDETDPREALVRRLLEYEQMKIAALRIDDMPRLGRDFEVAGALVLEKRAERLPDVSLHDLQLAWLNMARQARLQQHHTVKHEELSVREHMSRLLRRFTDDRHIAFEALFEPALGRAGVVVTFLAMLELVKDALLEIHQAEPGTSIYVRRAHAAEDA